MDNHNNFGVHVNGKDTKTEESTSSKIEFNTTEAIDNNVQITIKKKRGRKKKSEQLESHEKSKKLDMHTDSESISRSSRKRKSVNYFALANPDIISESEDDELDKKNAKSRNINYSKSKKTKSLEPTNEEMESNFIKPEQDSSPSGNIQVNHEVENIDNNEESNTEMDTQILNSVGLKKGSSKDDEPEEPVQSLSNNICETIDATCSEAILNKEKKYRKTGTTTQMLNTLFSQVDFKEDIEADGEFKPISISPIKRGRPSKRKKIENSGITVSVTTEVSIVSENKSVTCAVCKAEIDKNNWIYHKQRYHNNLAWRVGEPPLDLSNMDLVKQILNALYMARKLFYCDRCDKSMKSVNGFLSHKSVCGKPAEAVKVPCKFCNRKMMPVSLPSHIRHYHETTSNSAPVAKTSKKDTAFIVHAKRKAAEKALRVIQHFNLESAGIKKAFTKYFEDLSFVSSSIAVTMLQKQILTSNRVACKYPNCNFQCFSAEDIKQHLKFCINKPESGYVCKHCLLVQLTIADIIYHIETIHGVIIKVEGESDFDADEEDEPTTKNEKSRKSNKRKSNVDKDKAPKKSPFFLSTVKRLDQIFESAYSWTLEFCQKFYSTEIPDDHFPCLKENWELMHVDTVVDYLPRMGYSCDVGFETVTDFQDVLHKDHTFRKFHLFESYLENNGNSTIFCGGPINAFSWLPTPYTQPGIHQIVAVATRNHPDDKFTNDTNYNEKCVIQFWDVGPLKNLDTSMYRPRLGFCLSFEHGPVWDLQWCPSNCFDTCEQPEHSKKLKRMGVLAVAGSDSGVYVYSVPFFKSSGQFYNSRPVLILSPMAKQELILGNRKFYASRMSWSKASGHKYLAVGYTNGMVAMFNLWTDSNLLRKKDYNNVDCVIPYKIFQAHYHYISAIALYHLNDGCRWLLTGSYDRAVSLWDLNETSSPIQTVKRNIVNDAVWMTNWLCHVIAYDEASTIGQATSVIQQVRDFLSDPLYLFHCSAAITCITGSDWLNGIIQANAVGEIFATFPKQLMMNLNWKYLKNKKLLFGYTTLVEKDKTIEERLKENAEKEKALRNQLVVKTVIKPEEVPSNKKVTHLDYNPHYYEYEPLVYHEVDAKYGLLFCDHKMNSYSDFPPKLQEHMSFSSKTYASSKPNIYPLQAINKIEANMNRQATTYYAAGYQAGFLRLTCMRFLNKDTEVIADTTAFLNK